MIRTRLVALFSAVRDYLMAEYSHRPQGVPYLAKDLDELHQHIQALKTALEANTLGHGPEIDNFEDATTNITACCRWLTGQ